ncbi:hypothetical protein EON81_08530 [bacterium]|nr:MAG: hypothetical protein EON81_08530 [bacterium]
MERIRVRLLGTVGAYHADGLQVSFRTRQEKSIFARLVLARGLAIDRSLLARETWPDVSSEKATLSLRQRLHALRALFPESLLVDRYEVALDPKIVQCDLFDAFHEGQPLDAGEILFDIYLPWVDKARAILAGLSYGTLPGLDWPPTRSLGAEPDLNANALYEWLGQVIYHSATPHPYPDRLLDIQRRANGEVGNVEGHALWQCASAVLLAATADRGETIRLALHEAPVWEAHSPAAKICAGLAYEIAGNSAHNDEEYLSCLTFFQEAFRCYRETGKNEAALRLQFKIYRTQIDMGNPRVGGRHLEALNTQHRHNLSPHMRLLLDANLIFAHAAGGEPALARQAYERLKKEDRSDFRSLSEFNLSTLLLAEGSPKESAQSLLRAVDDARFQGNVARSMLAWIRGAEVLAEAGRGAESLFAYTLALRAGKETKSPVSVVNRGRAHSRVTGQLSALSGMSRIEAIREGQDTSFPQGHVRVMESLRRLAQTR